MKNLKSLFFAASCLTGIAAHAQLTGVTNYAPLPEASRTAVVESPAGLIYTKTITATAFKPGLYNRMKPWVIAALEPAYTERDWNSKKITTQAFVVLSEADPVDAHGVNEVVSFKAEITFEKGIVQLMATSPIYHRNSMNTQAIDIPLSESGAQQRFEEKFNSLMADMDRVAKGGFVSNQ